MKKTVKVEKLIISRDFMQDYKQPSNNHALKLLKFSNELGFKKRKLTAISWNYSPIMDEYVYLFTYEIPKRKGKK